MDKQDLYEFISEVAEQQRIETIKKETEMATTDLIVWLIIGIVILISFILFILMCCFGWIMLTWNHIVKKILIVKRLNKGLYWRFSVAKIEIGIINKY